MWSPTGSTIASASDDGTIKLWNTTTAECDSTLNGHSSHVTSVAWNNDGTKLASGSYDTTVRIWSVGSAGTFECESTLTGHSSAVRAVTWNPDGSMLASGSEDNTIKLWDAQSGKEISTLSGHWYDSPNCTCTFDEDGDLEEVNLRCPVSGHADW